jgi:GrpB-like predicted nucleotidyltransferase (UPF0157 family)
LTNPKAYLGISFWSQTVHHGVPGEQSVPSTEAQIIAATVGEAQVLNSAIRLSPYDPRWPEVFEHLKARISGALGTKNLRLEHVGSTSVPGLSAKPVIDMILVVADSSDESAYVRPLEEIGFVLRIREPGWHEHRVLCPASPRANLHVFSSGCEEIGRMLRFRDWLRAHPDDRARYEQKKRDLAARTWKYVQNYADAKTEVIREILSKADRTP